MTSLAKKLGLRPEAKIAFVNSGESASLILDVINGQSGLVKKLPPGRGRFDLIFYWPIRQEKMEADFVRLQKRIEPDGTIWGIVVKKNARRNGEDMRLVTWDQMIKAALSTDLVDNKVASLDGREYATRFVIRKEKRHLYR